MEKTENIRSRVRLHWAKEKEKAKFSFDLCDFDGRSEKKLGFFKSLSDSAIAFACKIAQWKQSLIMTNSTLSSSTKWLSNHLTIVTFK